MNNVEHRIKKIISKQLGINEKNIVDTHKFSKDLGADSLDIIELIMALEKEFNIEIPDKIIDKINSVKNTIEFINKLISM